MATEEHGKSTGWPLGLEVMSTRLRVTGSSQSAPAPAPPAMEPLSIHVRTISFSSFTSSNLDTESTASFFQEDNSVSLGRLIGIKAGNGRSLYFPNAIRLEDHHEESISFRRTRSVMAKGHGICIPLLMKMSRSKSKSFH